MGREIKRVKPDFNWPLNKVWEGFKNPYYHYSKDCPFCEGSGYSPRAKELSDMWYGHIPFKPEDNGSIPFLQNNPLILALAHRNTYSMQEYYKGREFSWENYNRDKDTIPMNSHSVILEANRLCDQCYNNHWSHHLNQEEVNALVKAGRLHDLTHTWSKDKGWQPKNPPVHPTAQEVNEWSITSLGHDCINQGICIETRCKKEKVPYLCQYCKGEGSLWLSKTYEKKCENWKPKEPPKGKAYQVWETVSEGSPVSPPFLNPEELAHWMIANDNSITKDTTFEQWYQFITKEQWAPSLIMTNGIIKTGTGSI